MEEKTNWEEFIEMNAQSVAERNFANQVCKMAIAEIVEEIKDCKTFHEVCSVIALIELKYGF